MSLEQRARELRQLVEQARDGFVGGQPYVLTYSDIIEQLKEIESLAAPAPAPAKWWKEYPLCTCGHGILDHEGGPVMAGCNSCSCAKYVRPVTAGEGQTAPASLHWANEIRNAALEEAALEIDQANREGPYNAIQGASRIRALKSAATAGEK